MPQPFTHQIRVRWGEVDAKGVVFNPNYLIYADVAGTEYYRHLGILNSDILDVHQVYIVDARLTFKASARADDLLTATVRPLRIGNSSFELGIDIARENELLTHICITYVRAVDGRARPLSDAFRNALAV